MFPGCYLKNFIIIESVTVDIFLIWTNVTRTIVAWTNVTVIVGICSRCSQEFLWVVGGVQSHLLPSLAKAPAKALLAGLASLNIT